MTKNEERIKELEDVVFYLVQHFNFNEKLDMDDPISILMNNYIKRVHNHRVNKMKEIRLTVSDDFKLPVEVLAKCWRVVIDDNVIKDRWVGVKPNDEE